MIVIGLTGPVHHGKSSFAEYLGLCAQSYAHFESSDLVIAVADGLLSKVGYRPADTNLTALNTWLQPLPEILNDLLHTNVKFDAIAISSDDYKTGTNNVDKLINYFQQPRVEDRLITADNKDDFRPLLQWLGAYLYVKIGAGVWYDEIKRLVIAEQAKGTELVIVGGVRYPSDELRLRAVKAKIIELQRPELSDTERADLTEQQRPLIHHESTIYNDGQLSDLKNCAQLIMNDLRQNKLKAEYYATRALAIS